MKKEILFSIVFSFVFMFSLQGISQERLMNGRVFTFDSIPLINASVEVKSTKQVVTTDTLGNFYVLCQPDDVLKVSARGFNSEKVKLNPKLKLALVNLKLKPGEKNREIAIGYGHVKDSEKLNAVANLNSGDMDFSQYSNLYEVIRGRFAGVQIISGEIIIRGQNSINSSSAALIVVDGVPSNSSVLSSIPPIQVKSINVIKDGSSAIYGSRGANGVVLIETKKGGDK
ncbi:MAG TPA: TonB-dependent receptor plug domain-containing protein [Draconibacterium sp.]|nr:TonB-dependent receptor plug domain-containing protein [Draconibacterium sp.]HRX11257.1 TonB-dependent receptor plug domain-containing protein [Draconibacterium sp.]